MYVAILYSYSAISIIITNVLQLQMASNNLSSQNESLQDLIVSQQCLPMVPQTLDEIRSSSECEL